MQVTIIGMGQIGSALMHVLQGQKDVRIVGWDKNTAKVTNQLTLEDSVRQADLVFLCIPSWNLRGALANITPHLKDTAGIISLAKGIEKESCYTADELIRDHAANHAFGILSGPMIAEEMLANKLTCGVLATSSSKLRSQAKALFKGSRLCLITNTDVHGTALCGVLKNAYTLGIGIAEGLGLGENATGAIFAHALGEMQMIVKLLGGKTSTVFGMAGAGDFYTTSLSDHSRNRKVGIVLGTGGDGHLESEGFISLTCLAKLVPFENGQFPLLASLIKICHEQAPANTLTETVFQHYNG